tara:strand:+ start:2407 stop:2793 length:387 start_codon:yes stop_codon:yes gene_type:complete
MAYKQNNPFTSRPSKLKLGSQDGEEIVPGVRIIRTNKLKPGIMAEANDDGSVFLSDKITAGSKEETKVLTHEVKHLVDLQTGKMKYNDTSLTWDGQEYARDKKNGLIFFEDNWVPEGNGDFPWENHKV